MFSLTSDQDFMVASTKRMVAHEIEPILARQPQDKPLTKEIMLGIYASLAELGITAPRLPAEAGGGGLTMWDYGLIVEQLPPVVALSLLSHEGTIARLYAGCPEDIAKAYLPDLIAGRKICCTANTESDAGSDSRAIRTRIEVEGASAFITGRKIWITNASIADIINVSCAQGVDDKGRPNVNRVLVERAASPFEVSEIPVMGLQQGHLGEMMFDRTRVPATHIIGEDGDAAKYLTVGWNVNRPLIGLMAVHLAQRAFDLALEHTMNRRQFGKTLAGHQLIQQDLADMETAIISARLMCFHALEAADKGIRSNGIAAMAKRYATQACEKAISLAMQVHGGMGISQELGIDRLWRDARMLQIPDGTNGTLALIQGRELTKVAAFR